MSVIYPVLEWVNRGEYKYLGGNYLYDGIIIHHPQGGIPYKIGVWNNGNINYIMVINLSGIGKNPWIKELKPLI